MQAAATPWPLRAAAILYRTPQSRTAHERLEDIRAPVVVRYSHELEGHLTLARYLLEVTRVLAVASNIYASRGVLAARQRGDVSIAATPIRLLSRSEYLCSGHYMCLFPAVARRAGADGPLLGAMALSSIRDHAMSLA
jgi:hypothetical protein